jgi:hypothetical protein
VLEVVEVVVEVVVKVVVTRTRRRKDPMVT